MDHYGDEDGDDFVHALDGEYDTVYCGSGDDTVVADLDDAVSDDCETRTSEPRAIPKPDVPDYEPPDYGGGYGGGGMYYGQPPPPPEYGGELPPFPGSEPSGCTLPPSPASRARLVATGTDASDCLIGASGDDKLSGAGGGDRLIGGDGRDSVSGGKGDDWIDGGAADDKLDGGSGADTVIGSAGKDAFVGGKGDDTLIAADGTRDTVDCGKGTDTAVVDRDDRVRGCEHTLRVKKKK
jgi:Ca2+-binding RTX toxin-like protein